MRKNNGSAWQNFLLGMFAPDPYDGINEHIVISGKNKVQLDGAVSILEYESEKVCLRMKNMQISVVGRQLQILAFSDKSMTIFGSICALEFK